jgi:ferredoxin--NADP+ reductase
MMDIAHWLIREKGVETVTAIARRGPAEVKFDKAEMKIVGASLDLTALEAELERCRPVMEAVGQSVDEARAEIMAGVPDALPPVTASRFLLQFLASPTALIGADGAVAGVEVEDTTLVKSGEDIKARGLGTKRVIPADTVVFAIGDQVDATFGLPVKWYAFVKNPNPRFPIDGHSYEAFDPESNAPIDGVFVAGWSREASTGLVGIARKDGTDGALAVTEYLKTVTPAADEVAAPLEARLRRLNKPVVSKEAWASLEAVEAEVARERGLTFFKYATNEEMLDAIARRDGQPA